jgi:HPt (histidine-containing phosphotransfer) domain-containing protein
MTFQEQMGDLLKRYCARLCRQIDMLDHLLSQSSGVDANSSVPLAKAQDITHEMQGTGGSMGFSDIAAAASALDDELKRLAGQDRISQSQLQTLTTLFARLRKVASQATPQMSRLYGADPLHGGV